MVSAAKRGERVTHRHKTDTRATHIRRFSKAFAVYACMAALLIGLAAMLPALFGSKTAAPSSQTTVTGTGYDCTLPIFEDLPEEERTVVIAFADGGSGSFGEHSFSSDETDADTTDTVDAALLKRNRNVEEVLGVTVRTEKVADSIADFESAVASSVLNNSGKWDIFAGCQYYSMGMAAKGLLYNLADLEAVAPQALNLDLDASYWATEYNDAMSYKGACYWITGDIALSYLEGMYGTFVNEDIYLQKLAATYGSIYDIVKQGKWTLDMMSQMALLCCEDDGDSIRNEADTFGFGYELNEMIDALAIGSNVQLSMRDPDTGAVMLALDNARTYQFAEKLYYTVTGGAEAYSYNYGNADSHHVMSAFAEGKVAFTVNPLKQAQVDLHNFDGYYIVPLPKLDETQTNYATAVSADVTVFGIPTDCTKLPQTVATLDRLALYGEAYVKPAYYDALLKGSYTNDPEVAEMINLIHDSTTTDFAAAWGYSLGDPVQAFRKEPYIDSLDRLKLMAWEQSLDELCKALDSIEKRTEEKSSGS